MPTPSRTGTPAQINASAASGSIAVSVPADCNLIVAFWAHWDANANTTLATLTLNGISFLPAKAELAEGAATDESGVGVAILVNPATGSQTVAWAWSAGGARTEGGELVLVFYRDGNASDPFRAAAVDANIQNFNALASLAGTLTTDRVVGFTQSYTGTNPTITGVTAFINDATVNSHVYDVGDATGLSGTVNVGNSTPSYSCSAAISLKQSVAAGGSFLFDPGAVMRPLIVR